MAFFIVSHTRVSIKYSPNANIWLYKDIWLVVIDYNRIISFVSHAKQANRCDIELTNYIHFHIKAYSSHASRLFGGWYVLHQTNKLENVPNGETCHSFILEHVVNSRAKVYSNLQDVTNLVVFFLQWVFLQYICHCMAHIL